MAELSTIARPYARAAFESASALSCLAAWSEALARAAQVVSDARVRALIGNPRVAAGELTAMVFELARKAKRGKAREPRSDQGLRNFFQLLEQNRRLPLLPAIAAQFESLRADAEQFAAVEVRSARELTAEQSGLLQRALERRLGRTVRLSISVDPTLIGGAVVQYGDFVVDGSLRRALERMGSAINSP